MSVLANDALKLKIQSGTAQCGRTVRARSARSLTGVLARPFEEEKMLPDKQKKAYKAFYDSARHNEYFDEKTTILLHLATAFAIGCHP